MLEERNMVTQKTWAEFKESGMLWFANRILHTFGWAIVFRTDLLTGEVISAFPARVKFRGFDSADEQIGFEKVSKFMRENYFDLEHEANLNDQ
jgi:hypothetical protein